MKLALPVGWIAFCLLNQALATEPARPEKAVPPSAVPPGSNRLTPHILISVVVLEVPVRSSRSSDRTRFKPERRQGSASFQSGMLANRTLLGITNFVPTGTNHAMNAQPGRFKYVAQLNADFDLLTKLLAEDKDTELIQKLRILTSHGRTASIFFGKTIPDVIGSGPANPVQDWRFPDQYCVPPDSEEITAGGELVMNPLLKTEGTISISMHQHIHNRLWNKNDSDFHESLPNGSTESIVETITQNGQTFVMGGWYFARKSHTPSGMSKLDALLPDHGTKVHWRELVLLIRAEILSHAEAETIFGFHGAGPGNKSGQAQCSF